MKLLFTSIGSPGHLHPSMPYALAARAAGHDVAFATPPATTSVVSALGFPSFPVGPDLSHWDAIRLAGVSVEGLPVEEQNMIFGRHWILGDHLTECIQHLIDLGSWWQPDLIVRGEIEFCGSIAAERLGLPHAMIKAYAYGDFRDRPEKRGLERERLEKFRADFGLPPDPELTMPYRYLDMWPFPASFRTRPYPSLTCRGTRPVAFDRSGSDVLPAWIGELPPRDAQPRVYVALGTAFEHSDVFDLIISSLRDEPVSLILTVGRQIDPKRFGSQPPNVHIEQYIPQSLLFPHCDLVICHGGSGTLLSALDHGLPMVMIPLGADQPTNARSAVAAGYARAITPPELTPESIRLAVRAVLADPSYRASARCIQAEIHPMPRPEQVVGWFERLARERVPADCWS